MLASAVLEETRGLPLTAPCRGTGRACVSSTNAGAGWSWWVAWVSGPALTTSVVPVSQQAPVTGANTAPLVSAQHSPPTVTTPPMPADEPQVLHRPTKKGAQAQNKQSWKVSIHTRT
jgi:hypothetical protein